MLITVDVMPAQMKLPFHVITDLETKPVVLLVVLLWYYQQQYGGVVPLKIRALVITCERI